VLDAVIEGRLLILFCGLWALDGSLGRADAGPGWDQQASAGKGTKLVW